MKRNTKLKIVITVIAILAISTITGLTYAFFSARVTYSNQTESLLKSKKIALNFVDTKEVNVEMLPGKSVEKTFNVESDAEDTVAYNIKISNITNTYNDDVVYTLYKNGTKVAGPARLPKTATTHYIYVGDSVAAGDTNEYVLNLEYLNTDEPQIVDENDTFTGTVEIDVQQVSDTLILTPETTVDISNEQKTNKFEFKNISSTDDTTYNVKLDNLSNEYAGLAYTLTKNGTVVKTGTLPTNGELPYLLLDQTLTSGSADKYKLVITNNDNSKNFSARIAVDYEEVDTTTPTSNITFVSSTSNSVTFSAECSNGNTQIAKYHFYKDGALVTTRETDASEVEYTYSNVTEGSHTFKLTCENVFGTQTSSSTTASTTSLVTPTYSQVNSGWATSKDITINYGSSEGVYLFKVSGTVTSSDDVTECQITDESASAYTCGNGGSLTTTTNLTAGTWYKADNNITLTFTSNGTLVSRTTDGTNMKVANSITIDNIDATAPSASITVLSATSNTTTVRADASDNESGITKYEFYLDNTLVDTITTSDTSRQYTYTGVTSGSHTYKVVATNGSGMTSEDSATQTTQDLETPTYSFDDTWTTSKDITVNYNNSEGAYLFKITGTVTSNINAVDCGSSSIDGAYTCSQTVVTAGNTLNEDTWYKVESNPTLTFTTSGSIIAKTADGTNWKQGSTQTTTKVDSEAPQTTLSTGTYTSGTWSNSDVEITINASDGDGSGIDYYEIKADDNSGANSLKRAFKKAKAMMLSNEPYTYDPALASDWVRIDTNVIKFTTDMDGYVLFRTVDTLGNASEPIRLNIKIDKTMPEVEFGTNGNSTYLKSQSTTVTVTDDHLEANSLKYIWNQSTTAPQESDFASTFTNASSLTKDTVTGDNWYLWILAKDEAGNTLITKTNAFYLDNTAPTGCQITGNPSTWASSATLTASASDANVGGLTYSWNTGATTATLSNLTTNGEYTVTVSDSLGNSDTCSVTVNKIDNTKPNVSIQEDSKTSNSITVTGSCSDLESGITKYEFYLDGTLKETYNTSDATKEYTYSNVAEGNHTLKLVCTNGAVNTDESALASSPASLQVPDYIVPTGYAQSKNITINYLNSEGAYLFKTTGAVSANVNVTDCGSDSIDGAYTCSDTTVTAGNALTANKWYKAESNPTLTFTSNGTIIAKTADGLNYKAGSSLNVEGVDRTAPPTPTIINSSNGAWTNTNVVLTVSSTDAAGTNETASGTNYFEYSYDEETWYTDWDSAVSSQSAVKTWSDAINQTVYVKARDAALNYSEVASTTVQIDKAAPQITLGSNSDSTYSQTKDIIVTLKDATSGLASGASVQYGFSTSNETAPTSWTNATIPAYTAGTTSDVTFTASGSNLTGSYYLWIHPVSLADITGNSQSTNVVSTGTFNFDNQAPTGCTLSYPNNDASSFKQSKVVRIAAVTDAHEGSVQYKWTSTGTYSSTKPGDQTLTANGTYTLYVKDGLGNETSCNITEAKIDRKAPTVQFGTNGNNNTYAKNGSTTVTVSDPADTDNIPSAASGVSVRKYMWTTSTTAPSNIATSGTAFTNGATINTPEISGTTPTGDYYLWIYAEDSNTDTKNTTTTKSNVFKLDNTAPTGCAITGNPTSWVTSATLSMSQATDSHNGTVQYSWDNSTWSTSRSDKTITANGTYTLYLKDGLGNSTSCSVTVDKIDRTGPTVSNASSLTGDSTYAKTKSITVNLQDAGSGLAAGASIQYGWSTSNTTAPTSWTNASISSYTAGTTSNVSFTASGSGLTGAYYLWIHPVTFTDTLSNSTSANVVSTGTYKFDNKAPEGCSITISNASDWKASKVLTVSTVTDSHNGDVYYKLVTPSDTGTYGAKGVRPGNASGQTTITANGNYTVYVKDGLGNETSCTATVSKIDTGTTGKPTISLSNPSDGQLTATVGATAGSSGITKYIIYYGTSSSNMTSTKEITSTATSASTTITGLTNGQIYYFNVIAYNGANTPSTPSDTVSKTLNVYRYWSTSVSTGVTSTPTSTSTSYRTTTLTTSSTWKESISYTTYTTYYVTYTYFNATIKQNYTWGPDATTPNITYTGLSSFSYLVHFPTITHPTYGTLTVKSNPLMKITNSTTTSVANSYTTYISYYHTTKKATATYKNNSIANMKLTFTFYPGNNILVTTRTSMNTDSNTIKYDTTYLTTVQVNSSDILYYSTWTLYRIDISTDKNNSVNGRAYYSTRYALE